MVNGETQSQLWPGPPSLLTLSSLQQYKGPICVVKSVYIPANSLLRSHSSLGKCTPEVAMCHASGWWTWEERPMEAHLEMGSRLFGHGILESWASGTYGNFHRSVN